MHVVDVSTTEIEDATSVQRSVVYASCVTNLNSIDLVDSVESEIGSQTSGQNDELEENVNQNCAVNI